MSGGLNPLGLVLLTAGVAQFLVLGGRAQSRLPRWLVALLVFCGILCLMAGVAVLLV
ncbi:hypothetical protein [Rhodospirillum rubrum]|uniref:Uncharacterized protein n=1 Tax=Rhodospirillum rubrum (strain ATCC 11170 / ATH 1.1.1 / DSM 467 / LMG 4362 / NCIMB 8255 / S1) TaxID=269796 RepID=Q2RT95_RHORT|nr:hypothetical protein [Rhodospirillum rubrum]ABC22650.1 hypothetical protein Rru_A1850 [Rhodospirillum rubrum ATCC 11170]AEO48368.1 hypothetical protein F11_09510 [Rhodospirillum rubrum F11]MBK5954247.1 hypothetical protein [Rhodospirillum rubrum]QXG82272.1 hypothetical protein KUL73_09575 [Rhodospirillum rubrum]